MTFFFLWCDWRVSVVLHALSPHFMVFYVLSRWASCVICAARMTLLTEDDGRKKLRAHVCVQTLWAVNAAWTLWGHVTDAAFHSFSFSSVCWYLQSNSTDLFVQFCVTENLKTVKLQVWCVMSESTVEVHASECCFDYIKHLVFLFFYSCWGEESNMFQVCIVVPFLKLKIF